MNLLPKSSSEFSQHEYWNAFFKTRGTRAFEWYGTYDQLCAVLHKYLSPRDSILVGGCGNSTLSANLYNAGFRTITNVDISETVIQQMTEQYAVSHPGMRFAVMDLLEMNFGKETFTCFLDKGTLDALMSGEDEESLERATSMFQGIDRVLKIGGRYICVSLLQAHILKALTSFFYNLGWMIRVCRCEEAEEKDETTNRTALGQRTGERSPFPVFAVVCTKFKKMERISPVMEYCSDEKLMERMTSLEELTNRVQSVQHFANFCHKIRQNSCDSQEMSIELMDPKTPSIKTPKYTLFVVNRYCRSENKLAAFVVPQGRETDWLFNSSEGRRQLSDNAKFQRLVIIHLGRDHKFINLDEVQHELGPVVSSLKPKDLPDHYQIPFLSLGAQVNQRKEIYRGVSDSTGGYVIEEVEEEENGRIALLRRLIFLSNPNVIQSEARLKKGKVDLKHLSCRHHSVMVEELEQHLAHVQCSSAAELNVVVLGLGGGALCTYIHQKFPSLSVEGVEIDACMVDLAKRFFGFSPGARLKAHVADALTFITDLAVSGTRYSCIMVDVDCKDRSLGISCPPPNFVELSFLQSIKDCLANHGLFLLNLVCRDEARRNNITDSLRELFANIQVKKIRGEVNEILVCSNLTKGGKKQTTSK